MKKSKVDRLIKEHAAKARSAGERVGAERERDRWTALLPIPGNQEVTWLGERPKELHRTLIVAPRSGMTGFASDYSNLAYSYAPEYQCLEFEAVPMALSLASGHQIRWFHWKPCGPYPVSELAVVRR